MSYDDRTDPRFGLLLERITDLKETTAKQLDGITEKQEQLYASSISTSVKVDRIERDITELKQEHKRSDNKREELTREFKVVAAKISAVITILGGLLTYVVKMLFGSGHE